VEGVACAEEGDVGTGCSAWRHALVFALLGGIGDIVCGSEDMMRVRASFGGYAGGGRGEANPTVVRRWRLSGWVAELGFTAANVKAGLEVDTAGAAAPQRHAAIVT